jgi:hypothetical protein
LIDVVVADNDLHGGALALSPVRPNNHGNTVSNTMPRRCEGLSPPHRRTTLRQNMNR